MSNEKATTKKRSQKERQKLFLAEFAQNANILLSAQKAGVNRCTVYKWLEHCPDFSFAFNQAKEDANDMLRAEVYRRAIEGVPEKVWQLGKYCGETTKYSDTLLIFLCKARMPEFRDKGLTINNVLPKEYNFDPNQDGVES
jgi:hypothetical protein